MDGRILALGVPALLAGIGFARRGSFAKAGPGDFKKGDIVRHTGTFLRSIGMFAGGPINGRVERVGTEGFTQGWPYVLWNDRGLDDEPKPVNPANLEHDPTAPGAKKRPFLPFP